MDIQYHALRILFENKLFYAPIGENPQRILDIGTGIGKSKLSTVAWWSYWDTYLTLKEYGLSMLVSVRSQVMSVVTNFGLLVTNTPVLQAWST
jgi:hypothetical protein